MYTLLIADDEELERQSFHLFFQRNFTNLNLLPDASNGSEVVEKVLHLKPDILILDIEMPGLNGLEALKIIRQNNQNLHVLIKTAYSKFDYAQQALNLHVDFFLLKPVNKEEMKTCITHIINLLDTNAQKTIDLPLTSPICKIALISSILHNWTDDLQIHKYAQNIGIYFHIGFIVLITFPVNTPIDKSFIINILEQNLSIATDFIIGAFEDNILPILCYYDNLEVSNNLQQNQNNLCKLISSLIVQKLHISPILSCGKAVSEISELRYSYQDALKQILPNQILTPTSDNPILKKAVSYIHENYYKDISLDLLATYLKMNASYLSHLFTSELHKNYTDYLNEFRITQAIKLLRNGITNINELSLRVGYTYPSYFCKLFKKYTGFTISEFKKEL